MIKSKNSSQHTTPPHQEARQKASGVARRRRPRDKYNIFLLKNVE
jgi:hypothetical protein